MAARGTSPFRLGAAMLLGSLALSPAHAVGGEGAVWREIAVHGEDVLGQVARPVAELKEELMTQGCTEFSLAYWSGELPARLRVEVRCRDWMKDMADAGGVR